MAIYTVDDNNIIAACSQAPVARTAGARFGSRKDLDKVTAAWPVSRLADTCNKLPIGGLKPVKKFTDRKTAVARIWAAVQNQMPVPGPDVAKGEKPATDARKRPQPDRRAH